VTTTGDPELVGREEELRRVLRFVDDVQHDARAVVIRGDAGIGKTTLWRAARDAAAATGATILQTRCVELEFPMGFGGLSDLFETVAAEVSADLPQPQRRALGVAICNEDPHDDGCDA